MRYYWYLSICILPWKSVWHNISNLWTHGIILENERIKRSTPSLWAWSTSTFLGMQSRKNAFLLFPALQCLAYNTTVCEATRCQKKKKYIYIVHVKPEGTTWRHKHLSAPWTMYILVPRKVDMGVVLLLCQIHLCAINIPSWPPAHNARTRLA